MANKQPYDIHPNEWTKFLTPDLRRHFERVGEQLVLHDVSHRNHGNPEKHFAALQWLIEKREGREARQKTILLVTKATLLVAVLTLLPTIFWNG